MKKNFTHRLAALGIGLLITCFLIFSGELVTRMLKLSAKDMSSENKSVKIHHALDELKGILSKSGLNLNKRFYPTLENEEVDYSKKFVPDILVPNNQTKLLPNIESVSQAISKKSGTTIYKVQVTTNSYGRRLTKVSKSAKSNILFFGDSFTFGEGVNDDETFPHYLSLRRTESAIYNLGVPGLGLNDILFDLEAGNRLDDIPRRKTISVYTFIHDHLLRFFCGLSCYRTNNNWLLLKPQYSKDLDYLGSFSQDNSIRANVYKLFSKSKLLEFLNIDWPIRFSDKDLDVFVRAVLKVKNLTKKNFGSEEFYFVFYPRDTSLIYAYRLIPLLKKYKINYLIYEEIDFNDLGPNVGSIPLDRHPSPAAHYLTAFLLDRDLPK